MTQDLTARQNNIISSLKTYAEAYTTAQYSIANFRIINNISDEEFRGLKSNDECKSNLELIDTKMRLNIENRLLDPDIKSSEVNALRTLMEKDNDEESVPTSVINNITFATSYDEITRLEQEEFEEE